VTKKPKKNRRRDLDAIAADIHKAERVNIFQIGKLLIEAKAQCAHGEWLDWLSREFDWSADTAHNYMNVADLTAKFGTIRNLPVPATTLYALTHLDPAIVPAAIARLGAAEKKGRVTAEQGRHIVKAAGRTAAIKVISKKREDEMEAEQILDGPPPELPPPTDAEEPLQLGTDTPDIDVKDFTDAVEALFRISTRGVVAKLTHAVVQERLRSVVDFLTAVVERES
jgi:hypothetical protein